MGSIIRLLDADDKPRLFPQPFEVVVGAEFWIKDMDNHVAIVDQNPTRFGFAFNVQAAAVSSFGLFLHLVQDGLELRWAIRIAKDEIVSQQGNLLHVQHGDVGAKPLGNGVHDYVSEFD